MLHTINNLTQNSKISFVVNLHNLVQISYFTLRPYV